MNKRIIISLAVIALLAGGVAFAMWQSSDNDTPPSESSLEDPAQPVNEGDERRNDDEESNDENNTGVDSGNNDGAGQGSQPNEPSDSRTNVSPIMSSWNYNDGTAQIRAYVDGVSSGTCTVVFEKAGYSTVRRQAPIGLQGTTYVCQGFDVERSAFPANGNWTVRVEFFSDTARGASQTETIRIP